MNAKDEYRELVRSQLGEHFDKQRKSKAKRQSAARRATEHDRRRMEEYSRDSERRTVLNVGDIDPDFFSIK